MPDPPDSPPTEPTLLYVELLGDVDGEYKNCEGGRRYAPEEVPALEERERARRNLANVAFVYSDGSRIRHHRFMSDGADVYVDPVTGDLLFDGVRVSKGAK